MPRNHLVSFIYSDAYLGYQFGPGHPFKSSRARDTLHLLRELGLVDGKAQLREPEPASEEELRLVHSREYLEFVRRACARGAGFLDFGDTPATRGLYEGGRHVVGGSLLGARLLMQGEAAHAFNPGGGLHHAMADAASGFCVFNDIAIAVRYLQTRHRVARIAVVDIDGHHGDGTQAILYREPILKVSMHRSGIFPGTGYPDELGDGPGHGYSVNLPLPGGTNDELFLHAYREAVLPLVERYAPEIIMVQCGVDGHLGDPLVGLALTAQTYITVCRTLHALAHRLCDGRLLLFGGGGYDVANTVRCWTVMFATILDEVPTDVRSRYRELATAVAPSPTNPIAARAVRRSVEQVKRCVFPIHGL
jgi:acetoin utilization protein AcuC